MSAEYREFVGYIDLPRGWQEWGRSFIPYFLTSTAEPPPKDCDRVRVRMRLPIVTHATHEDDGATAEIVREEGEG